MQLSGIGRASEGGQKDREGGDFGGNIIKAFRYERKSGDGLVRGVPDEQTGRVRILASSREVERHAFSGC